MIRITLVCSAGMSTSMLVVNMQKVAKQRGIEADIEAVAETDLKRRIGHTDVLLLGPQVRFLLNKFKKEYGDKVAAIDVIDMTDYGRMNGENVLNKALALFEKK